MSLYVQKAYGEAYIVSIESCSGHKGEPALGTKPTETRDRLAA